MKKILSLILPGIIIFAIAILSRADKNIFKGMFLLFPIIFIIQGIICLTRKELIIGYLLSSIAFILPVNLFYNMGTCIEFLIIYLIIGLVGYFFKQQIKK